MRQMSLYLKRGQSFSEVGAVIKHKNKRLCDRCVKEK